METKALQNTSIQERADLRSPGVTGRGVHRSMKFGRMESLEDVIAWIQRNERSLEEAMVASRKLGEWKAFHDAQRQAWWAEQRRWNKEHEKENNQQLQTVKQTLGKHSRRLDALERKLMWIAGATAAAGGGLGTAVATFFGA